MDLVVNPIPWPIPKAGLIVQLGPTICLQKFSSHFHLRTALAHLGTLLRCVDDIFYCAGRCARADNIETRKSTELVLILYPP